MLNFQFLNKQQTSNNKIYTGQNHLWFYGDLCFENI